MKNSSRVQKDKKKDLQKLVHDLKKHQVELETQNEELRQARQNLEDSRLRYAQLFDFAPIGYFVLSREGIIQEVNSAGARMLGFEKHDLFCRPFSALVLNGDREIYYGHLRGVFDEEIRRSVELRMVRKDKSSIHVQLESVPEKTRQPAFCRTAMIDITERKQAEEALAAAHTKTSDILEKMSDGFATFDHDWRYTQINHEAARLFHMGSEQLPGKTLWEMWPAAYDHQVGVQFRRSMQEKISLRFEAFYPEPLNRWFECRCYPMNDGLATFFSDITEGKRADEELRADMVALTRMHALSSGLLEKGLQPLLQEIMDAAVAIMKAERGTLRLLEDNWLKILAHHGHQNNFLEFFGSPENRASACKEAKQRGERVIVPDVETSSLFVGTPSLSVLREAGVRALQSTPIISRSGALLGILTTHWGFVYTPTVKDLWRIDLLARQAADLIEHSRAEDKIRKAHDELELRVQERTAELERKNRELQDFAFIASHDLNEPLRKIQTFGSLLEAKSADRLDEQSRDYVIRMTGAASRMQELLDALLRYSRVDTKRQEFRSANLEDIAKDAATDLEVAIQKIEAHVEVSQLPIISGDPYQLRQLFQNLIANAVKYHRSVRTFIKIHGEKDDGIVRIFVEDNGIGFDEKFLDKIFQPFQQLHGRNEYPGTGIGLAICKKIVERHGGTITAKSTPGKGSTFIVTLPAKQGKA